MENVIDRHFAGINFYPTVIMTFDNTEAIKAMIRADLGVSMPAFWVVDADLRKGSLSMIQQREHPLFSKLDLVRRKSSHVLTPVAAFIEVARDFEWKHPRLKSQ